MDEGAKTTCKIVESVHVARGWVHSNSEGYLPDTNSPLLTARRRREALKNMYLIVTENLRCARGTGQHKGPVKSTITPNQLVTLKVHLRKTLAP